MNMTPNELTVPANEICYQPVPAVIVQAGHRYRCVVSGKWIDWNEEPVNANGALKPGFPRNLLSAFKRSAGAPWMALLVRSQGEQSTSSWHWLHDGENTLIDLPAGELQFCANDMRGFYRNNRGSLVVLVSDCTDQG